MSFRLPYKSVQYKLINDIYCLFCIFKFYSDKKKVQHVNYRLMYLIK